MHEIIFRREIYFAILGSLIINSLTRSFAFKTSKVSRWAPINFSQSFQFIPFINLFIPAGNSVTLTNFVF